MKFKLRKLFCTGMVCALAVSAFTGNVSALEIEDVKLDSTNQDSEQLAQTTVYVVGDSTACIYKEDETYALPRAGWAMYLQSYLDEKAEVVDLALSGRSSKSFTVEPEYETLKENIKAGDYLIIQFGHNDAKSSTEEDLANRYTDPLGDIETEGSFKYVLYNNYVKLALDAGATPILVSPVSRRGFDENDKIKDSHGDYDDAVRELAAETNTAFIDMTAITEEFYNGLGVEGSKLMHALYNDRTKSEGVDNTHFSHYGASVIAGKVAEEIAGIDTGLKDYVSWEKFTDVENNYITKGEFVATIARALSLEADQAEATFDDVPADYENSKYIAIAKELGIAVGDQSGELGFSNYITRQEMAAVAYRAISKVKELEPEDLSSISGYDDFSDVYEYAKPALSYMIGNGYMDTKVRNGYAGNIAPLDIVTKEEAAKVVLALYELQAADIIAAANEESVEISIDELEKVEDTK